MDKKNSLIKSEKSIFNKIVFFFKNIFFKSKKDNLKIEEKKEDVKLVEEKIINEEENLETDILDIDEELLLDLDSEVENFDIDFSSIPKYVYTDGEKVDFEKEKARIFEVYKSIRNSTIKIEDVEIIDLLKINDLLKEEEKIKYERLNIILVEKSSQ